MFGGSPNPVAKHLFADTQAGQTAKRISMPVLCTDPGLNLVAAAIIHWNTRRLGQLVTDRTAAGKAPDPALLPHVSPLGWEHIHLTGEYRWPS